MNYPFTITNDSVTAIIDGTTYTVKRGDKSFEEAKAACIAGEWGKIPTLVSRGLGIQYWAKGRFSFRDGYVWYDGRIRVPEKLNKKVMQMADNGEDPTYLMKFYDRLQQNPSYRSVQQVYDFLVHEGISIDEQGFILAYKSVRPDYKDWHSGTVDNHPGQKPEMPRNQISDDPDVPCHEGFHVGALAYAETFGGNDRKILICRVDPADVVCVPKDSSQHKVRVCKYEVVGHYAVQLPDTTFKDEDAKSEVKETETETMDWKKFDAMDRAALETVSLGLLRTYAARHCKIVGASKIPGGKPVLIEKILDTRK